MHLSRRCMCSKSSRAWSHITKASDVGWILSAVHASLTILQSATVYSGVLKQTNCTPPDHQIREMYVHTTIYSAWLIRNIAIITEPLCAFAKFVYQRFCAQLLWRCLGTIQSCTVMTALFCLNKMDQLPANMSREWFLCVWDRAPLKYLSHSTTFPVSVTQVMCTVDNVAKRCIWIFSLIHYHQLPLNRQGRRGTTDDLAPRLWCCLPISALCSSPFHGAWQHGLGQT